MATTTFTLQNGVTVSVESTGNVWQGHSLVPAAGVEAGGTISVGCGFAQVEVTGKVTI
jgi:hypothetical protein